jgi:hypothetical protein
MALLNKEVFCWPSGPVISKNQLSRVQRSFLTPPYIVPGPRRRFKVTIAFELSWNLLIGFKNGFSTAPGMMFPSLLCKAPFAIEKAHVVNGFQKKKKQSHRLSGPAGGSPKGSSLTCNPTRDLGAGLDSLDCIGPGKP